MKYFEKQASVESLIKAVKAGAIDVKGAVAMKTKLELKKNRILKLKHTKPDVFYSPAVQQRKAVIHDEIIRHQSIIKKMASTTSPFQGTMLNVQTRTAQRKYDSKILGKKKPNVLVPLWFNSNLI
jgi:hypothetical protein